MRAASSTEAFLEELEAIKALSLGLGQLSGLAEETPAKKQVGGKATAAGRVKQAATAAVPAAKGWPAMPVGGTTATNKSATGAPAVSNSAVGTPAAGKSAVSNPAAGPSAPRSTSAARSLCSKGLLLPGEDPAEFETFVKDFCTDLSAVGVVQTTFATRAAELSWKLRRLPAMEAAILSSLSETAGKEDLGIGGMGDVLHQLIGKDEEGILMRLQQYETRIERSITRCLREVKVLQMTKLREAGLRSKEAVGSFRTGAVGSFGKNAMTEDAVGSFGTETNAHGQPSVGLREAARVVEASSPARGPSAARQDDGLAGVRLGLGSFGKEAVGSFGKETDPHGQPVVGIREGASVVEASPPARGPSAARQDDGFAGVRLGLGSFGMDAVGSF